MKDVNYRNWEEYTAHQLTGSEFGGVEDPRNSVQPKGQEALTAGEKLRLSYLVGDESDSLQETPLSLTDRRQMWGLKPASDLRPTWLVNTGKESEAELLGLIPEEIIEAEQ